MKWINVKEKLPNHNNYVLVYYDESNNCQKCFYVLRKSKDEDNTEAEKWNRKVLKISGKLCYTWEGFRSDLQPFITHWMELPKNQEQK